MTSAGQQKRGVLPLLFTMVWIAGLPTFVIFANRVLSHVPVLKADRVLCLLAAAMSVVAALRRPRTLQPVGRVEKAMVVYLTVILVSWVTTLPHKTVAAFKQDADFLLTCFLMPFTAFLIARNTPWTPLRIRTCLWALVGGVGTYLVLFGAVQYTYDWNFLVAEAIKNVHPDRAKGPFENAVPYGVVLSMLVPLTLFLYARARGRLARGALVTIAIGLIEGIVASKTRAIWVGLPVALVLPSLRHPRIRPLAALLTADLALQVLLAPAVGLDFWGLQQRLVEPEPVYARVAASATASNMAEHRPLFGFGFGMFTFQDDKAAYYASWGSIPETFAVYPNSPHNDFLNVLVCMGLFGLIPYLVLLWTSWQVLSRGRARGQPGDPVGRELAGFIEAVFVILLIVGQFHAVMRMSYAQVLFFFLLGIVAREPGVALETADGRRRSTELMSAPEWSAGQPAARISSIPAGGAR